MKLAFFSGLFLVGETLAMPSLAARNDPYAHWKPAGPGDCIISHAPGSTMTDLLIVYSTCALSYAEYSRKAACLLARCGGFLSN